jgi:4-amino-4-deoxy-L-arabinose transferase-like glycosyltransferase
MAILFALGVLTKSIAAFFILPGLVISVFVFKTGRKLLLNKWFYVALMIFLLIVGSYYITREFMQPGYLKAVWHWELFPRFANTENKFYSGTFWFYGVNFFKSRFNYWIYFLLASLIALPFLTRGETRKLYYFLLINMVAFFLVISLGSKGLWYDGPLFPLFSLAIALFLYHVWRLVADHWHCNKVFGLVVTLVIATMLYLSPALSIMKKVSRTYEYPWDYEFFSMAYWLRENNFINSVSTPLKVVDIGYNAQLLFYVEAINYAQQEKRLFLINPVHINPGDLILISQKVVLDSIDNHYKHEVPMQQDPVKLIQIGDRIEKEDK